MAFITILEWEVPEGHYAIITSIHQALESPAAYEDCDVRIMYRGASDEWWDTEKAEVTPVSIALTEKERIAIQVQNNGIVTHFCDAEIAGFTWDQDFEGKNQHGFSVKIGLSNLPPIISEGIEQKPIFNEFD